VRFNSVEFAVFLPIVWGLWLLLRERRRRHVLLLVASYLFYASWNAPFLLLLWFTTWLDYVAGSRIADATSKTVRRAWLLSSIGANLAILAYFKYGNFFVDNVAFVSGVDPEPFYLNLVIPLGISFYTFQSMSYTLDVYRGEAPRCRSLLDFALFVSFFPHLIAGPILRTKQFLPQLERDHDPGERELVRAVELFLGGLFGKMVVADNFAILADRVFADPLRFSAAALWMGAIAFAIQVFADFNGYSQMARGLGHLFGYTLPRNFDYPLLRWNPLLVRQSWHMTIGRWFADYVFRPLGGASRGDARLFFNLVVMWTLIGLWHGASWHFVVWGFNNGVILGTYLVVLRRKTWSLPEFPGKRFLGWIINMGLWIPSVIFFRSQNMEEAGVMFRRLLTFAPGDEVSVWWYVFALAAALLHFACFKWDHEDDLLERLRWPARIALVTVTVLAIAAFAGAGRTFIYFQF
jgi:alginate O-acetyltransferase complex protein AlgI